MTFLASSGQATLRETFEPPIESRFTQVGSEATQMAKPVLGDRKEEQGCAPEGPCPGTSQPRTCAERTVKTGAPHAMGGVCQSGLPDPLPWT